MKAIQITETLEKLREKSPLVHNITNYVVMNNTANALLSIGASPVMAHATNEVEDMVAIASALVINMGTLSEKWVEGMILAGRKATEKGIPVIFDPVGVGATPYRNTVAQKIIEECTPSVIRGNASEIMAILSTHSKTKGVDSTISSNIALDSAKALAKTTRAVVVISGETDYITDGKRVIGISNGTPMMSQVTGLGCTASALIGAFAGVEKDMFVASVSAMAVMGIAGEMAFAMSEGPGSMQMHFIDQLYKISKTDIEQRLKMSNE